MGARLRELRLERGLTEEALALESGVSRNQIVAVERGRSSLGIPQRTDLALIPPTPTGPPSGGERAVRNLALAVHCPAGGGPCRFKGLEVNHRGVIVLVSRLRPCPAPRHARGVRRSTTPRTPNCCVGPPEVAASRGSFMAAAGPVMPQLCPGEQEKAGPDCVSAGQSRFQKSRGDRI